jgi:hypothetical protein
MNLTGTPWDEIITIFTVFFICLICEILISIILEVFQMRRGFYAFKLLTYICSVYIGLSIAFRTSPSVHEKGAKAMNKPSVVRGPISWFGGSLIYQVYSLVVTYDQNCSESRKLDALKFI